MVFVLSYSGLVFASFSTAELEVQNQFIFKLYYIFTLFVIYLFVTLAVHTQCLKCVYANFAVENYTRLFS